MKLCFSSSEYLKAQRIGGMCFVFWNYYWYLQRRLFSVISSETRGRVKEKMMVLPAGTCHHSPVPRESSSVFSTLAASTTSELSRGFLPRKRESCYVTSSILEFKGGEQMPKHEYKTAVDQAQGCTWTWGFLGPWFGRNLKYSYKESMFSLLVTAWQVLRLGWPWGVSDGFLSLACDWLSPFL